jgi:hypothetical protein
MRASDCRIRFCSSGDMADWMRCAIVSECSQFVFAIVVSLGFVGAHAARIEASDHLTAISDPIHVPPELQSTLALMLETSATFRAQYQRLSREPRLYVRVQVDPQLEKRSFRAQSVINRTHSGAIVAFVSIAPGNNPTEWLAHEFEHVIEQLEGVELKVRAAARDDVWRTELNMFETGRAVDAGRVVLDEVRGALRPGGRLPEDRRRRSVKSHPTEEVALKGHGDD